VWNNVQPNPTCTLAIIPGSVFWIAHRHLLCMLITPPEPVFITALEARTTPMLMIAPELVSRPVLILLITRTLLGSAKLIVWQAMLILNQNIASLSVHLAVMAITALGVVLVHVLWFCLCRLTLKMEIQFAWKIVCHFSGPMPTLTLKDVSRYAPSARATSLSLIVGLVWLLVPRRLRCLLIALLVSVWRPAPHSLHFLPSIHQEFVPQTVLVTRGLITTPGCA